VVVEMPHQKLKNAASWKLRHGTGKVYIFQQKVP
jgi:hypothetical protein